MVKNSQNWQKLSKNVLEVAGCTRWCKFTVTHHELRRTVNIWLSSMNTSVMAIIHTHTKITN